MPGERRRDESAVATAATRATSSEFRQRRIGDAPFRFRGDVALRAVGVFGDRQKLLVARAPLSAPAPAQCAETPVAARPSGARQNSR